MGRTGEVERARRRGTFLREVEDAYYEHAAVQHAVVVEDDTDSIRAFVELRPGHDASEDQLVGSSTHVVPRMPRTFSGKADRRTLAASTPS
jgi:acyl-coenzyme A synthetase/AMP-(fatty) acid ligase